MGSFDPGRRRHIACHCTHSAELVSWPARTSVVSMSCGLELFAVLTAGTKDTVLLIPEQAHMYAAQVAASGTAAECTELPACKGFADQLPAQTQYGYLTCDSQYRQVDESAPAGVTVKMVCPVSCNFCPEDLSDLSDEERCLKSSHCFPRFEVCMDGYGGFPDCRHMPQATRYDGKTNSHGQPHGYGKLGCALNEQGYHASGINTQELRAQMAQHHACEYIGDFSGGERQGDGVFRHTIQATAEGGKFSYSYDGEWTHDVKEGTGRMSITFAVPDQKAKFRWTYDGEWKSGLPNGTGRLENTDGTVYNGPLQDGAPHGFGTLCAGQGHDATCVQIDFAAGLATGEGTVVTDSHRYRVDCGKAGEQCFLVPRLSQADSEAAPDSLLRFEHMTELWESVLPAAIENGLVAPISGGMSKVEL